MLKNVTTIIRSAGERTVEFCRYLIAQQVIENNIFIINEIPFSSAIIKSYKIGYESPNKFSAAFRKQFGYLPFEFMNIHNKTNEEFIDNTLNPNSLY